MEDAVTTKTKTITDIKMDYNDLVKLVSGIPDFKKMVQQESKRPIAVRMLTKLADISEHEAWAFVSDYYDNMDINFKRVIIKDPTRL